MQKRHGFISLILLVFGVLTACAPAPATDAPITTEPTEEPTVEVTDAPTDTPTATDAPTEAATAEPTATLPSVGGFTPISNSPILETRKAFMDPGAVVYHDGMYHIFANDFAAWPARVDIIYARSEDGINWEQPSSAAILNETDVEYAELAILATSAVVQEDGTWALYFYTWDSTTNPTTGRIGRATASTPEGPWTADPQPVLEPGADGAWDATKIGSASVLAGEDGGYVMYYAANTPGGPAGGIGMATSADGITWTKYDDPTTDGAYAESDPIFGAGEEDAWDALSVFQPNVVRTEDGYVMLYSGIRNPAPPERGFAFSEDGIHWTRHSQNPVLPPNIVRGGTNIWFTNLLYVDGTFKAFLEVGKAGNTRIYIATHEGKIEE